MQHRENPIPDVRFDYCNIDSRCDEKGTVTKTPGYKYDIFNYWGEKVSSFTPTIASSVDKIYGGERAKVGEVPWQVNLLYPTYDSQFPVVRLGSLSYYSFCGGVIVGKSKVISAAHCLELEKIQWK